jgi:hypothetical protein
MTLSNNIKRLEYGDWVFKGDNTTLTMADMAVQIGASLRTIGAAFNLSYEMVRLRFKDLQETHPELWQQIKSKQKFYQNFIDLWRNVELEPADICAKLFISMGQYRKLEHKLIPKDERRYRVSVPRRKTNLCQSLFGYQFNLGDKFDSYIKRLFKKYLSDSECDIMMAYYFDGVDAPQEQRFDRFKYSKKLKIEFDHNELLERNVICQRKQEM